METAHRRSGKTEGERIINGLIFLLISTIIATPDPSPIRRRVGGGRFSTGGWINVIERIHVLVLSSLLPVVRVTGREARYFAYYKIGVFYTACCLGEGWWLWVTIQ